VALSTVYRISSNFVHSRYPEVMEMINGDPLSLHLNGMKGTPRDEENLDVLEAFVESVSNALKFMLVYMKLLDRLSHDPALTDWFGLRAA
jgi:hypothetical protein